MASWNLNPVSYRGQGMPPNGLRFLNLPNIPRVFHSFSTDFFRSWVHWYVVKTYWATSVLYHESPLVSESKDLWSFWKQEYLFKSPFNRWTTSSEMTIRVNYEVTPITNRVKVPGCHYVVILKSNNFISFW